MLTTRSMHFSPTATAKRCSPATYRAAREGGNPTNTMSTCARSFACARFRNTTFSRYLSALVFGLSRSMWVSLIALVIVGGSDMVSVVIRGSILQLATPPEMRGLESSSFHLEAEERNRDAEAAGQFVDLGPQLDGDPRELGRQSRRMQAQLDEVVGVCLRQRHFDAGLESLFES